MRLLIPASILALAAAIVSSNGVSQTGKQVQTVINPQSQTLATAARTELSAGRLDEAAGLLETALAVDPRNRSAYVLLGDVSRRQGLPGKAIRFYREALTLDPNDRAALAGQGEALVAKGAVAKARENLAKLSTLCGGRCPEQGSLAAAIDRGPPVVAQAQGQPASVVQ